ncbi:MAG: putative 2-dehydropantoate 2-reductase (Ketopantoate reductase) reductase, partial [Deltaproteobacteria bacterium]|nr:putative 2-dehydropantoate 2-reductase (Ketopantoate reductase) reductase [Deltaproteobacteria bacterium]
MRIAVMGTGAVGGYFGAKLAAAGDDVVFIARQRHLPGLRRNGLRIESFNGDLHVRNGLFTDSPADAGMVDLVLFCVKSYDTTEAAAALAPMISKQTAILSLQNGIDNPDKIAGFWGTERTLAGVVYIGAQVSAPGVIQHSSGGKIVLGPISGHPRDTAHRVEQRL